MKIRTSALDGGLYELTHASNETDVFLSDGFEQAQSTIPYMNTPGQKRGPASRPSATIPDNLLTVKVLTALGKGKDALDKLRELEPEIDIIDINSDAFLVNLPKNRLEKLGEIESIKRAEAPRRLHFCLDKARGTATGTDVALTNLPDLRGSGVVVGVMDSGLDWRHEDFLEADLSSSRVELFVHAVHNKGKDQYTEHNKSDIESAIQGQSIVPQGDLNGHGTHCASIAAGNGQASSNAKYRGVAPGATLMAVRSDTLHDTHIAYAIKRIFDAAGDRPAVINLSLGGHWGAHDGTAFLENVIEKQSGPGRIVVVASGNEAEDRIHFNGQLVQGQNLDIEFTIRDGLQYINTWIPRGDDVDIFVIDPNGNQHVPTGSVQAISEGSFRADLRIDRVNRDVNLIVAVAANQLGRRWRIRLVGRQIVNGMIHAWASTNKPNLARGIFMSQRSQDFTIGMPATEERAISVGSFVTRQEDAPNGTLVPGATVGGISPFSSRGPTRIGVQRPDITAPGQHIVAALAAGSEMATSPNLQARRLSGGKYISIQGTSMATPFVTGVIALMLEQEPSLTPEDIRIRLRATASRDSTTGPGWNSTFGYGKINVGALLNYSTMV